MSTLTKIPIETFIRGSGRGRGNNGPLLPKFFKNYLIFSFCFGIYGFTRGYRGPESTIKYLSEQNYLYELEKYIEKQIERNKNSNQLIIKENFEKEFDKYYKKKIDNKISQISIMDKIANGIIEVYPFYLPILNIKPIYCLLKRIEIYFLRYVNPYSNKQYYTNNLLAEVCYETI